MIALAINIACTVGRRAAKNVIKTFFDWLQIKAPIPDWTSTRQSLRPVPNETLPNTKCDSANRTGVLHASLAEAEGTLYELGVAAKLGRDDSLAVVSSEVWLSTEILESSFGQYKLLERQHSKGGFTTLIAAFPGLLKPCTAELVKQTFSRMTVSKLKEWTFQQFGRTLASRRQEAYPTNPIVTKRNPAKPISIRPATSCRQLLGSLNCAFQLIHQDPFQNMAGTNWFRHQLVSVSSRFRDSSRLGL